MRSLKHLKHHTRTNVEEEDGGRLVGCYPKLMEGQADAGTQTEPVVVLSLAQAAVLGLISQNEVFGATIAPNGFYTGEARDSLPGPGEDVKYEYASQLIGANGDYLGEGLEDEEEGEEGGERRRAGPLGRGRKGEAKEPAERASPAEGLGRVGHGSCAHLHSNPPLGEGPYSVALKQEQPPHGCPDCEREARAQEGRGQGAEGQEGEGAEVAGSPLRPEEGGDSPEMSRYFESSEVGYESGEAAGPTDYEEGGAALLWGDGGGVGAGADGPLVGRRTQQIDRLDINVQIDESYCVDVGEGLRRWKCRMCEKSYTSKYNLVTHILGHNGIKPHECPRCGKLFKQPSHLQTHLLTHQGTRPHKCAVCKKAFTQTSHLKRHMLQHTDVKPYSCRFCRRGFAYPSELRAHETKHESGRCHVCPQCGMELPSLAHLKRHQTTHQGPSAFQCPECAKSFAYRSQLQNHLMKHQNVRPYVCSACGMEFVQIHHLKQHALTHKGMKEFKCDVCAREFTLSANLKRHMLIHTSVRPYQCHVCFKTFVQKQTLKTHMIVHLPVKPFKCKVCGKSFNRMYNLLGHMHLHAGSKPFKCPYCSSKFNLKGNLSRHMKVKHGIADLSLEGHAEEASQRPALAYGTRR
ncbi:zinc finger protein 710a [Conger conger]|uniref:zinc finger protein 710a n=1 Tax=Conger conger TaxID=82655 RepID=UPI002A5AC893|nr:zinc finger protein 710a [Conger conger]